MTKSVASLQFIQLLIFVFCFFLCAIIRSKLKETIYFDFILFSNIVISVFTYQNNWVKWNAHINYFHWSSMNHFLWMFFTTISLVMIFSTCWNSCAQQRKKNIIEIWLIWINEEKNISKLNQIHLKSIWWVYWWRGQYNTIMEKLIEAISGYCSWIKYWFRNRE